MKTKTLTAYVSYYSAVATAYAAIVVATMLFISGCSLFGKAPSAPTAIERALYTLQTNYIAVVVPLTNTVTQTNLVIVMATNVTGVVELHQVTNVTQQVNVVTVTNVVPAVTLTTSPQTVATVQGVGTAINTFVPGVGGMVSTGLLALLSLWGYLRGNKQGNTANALAQEIETVRTFIKSLPNGTQMDTSITTFLQQHQLEAGVVQNVMDILQKQVSSPDAQVAAKEISATVAALK